MSAGMELPDEVRQFVLRNIDSVAELEALLLIRGHSEQVWDAPELARRLYVEIQAATAVLEALDRRQFLSRESNGFRYRPQSEEIRASVDAVAASYPKFLIPITNLIHAKPPAAVQQFADAFRLRENK